MAIVGVCLCGGEKKQTKENIDVSSKLAFDLQVIPTNSCQL